MMLQYHPDKQAKDATDDEVEEATASYRATCQRAACDPGIAAYHACLVTSGWLHASAGGSGYAGVQPAAARAVGLAPSTTLGSGGELGPMVPARGGSG